MRWSFLLSFGLLLLLPSLARADYEPGIVPEGMNAFVQRRHDVHVSLLGTSTFAATSHTEIATYLLADAVLFPNLRIEHQLGVGERGGMSLMLGAGAGALPLAAGGVVPFPGGVLGGGGVGFAWGSIQTATLVGTVRFPDQALSLSANGGVFMMEGGIAGVVAGGAAGGGGAGATGGEGSTSGSRPGWTAGAEIDRTFGKHDALVIAVDSWAWRPVTMDGTRGLIYPRIAWTHVFGHWQLSGGVYTLLDRPDYSALDSRHPVSPYANVAWNH